MPHSIANLSLRDLDRRIDEVAAALKYREPLLFGEYLLLLDAKAKFDRSPDKPYAEVKYPRAAILLCLERNGKWMTRKQIRRDLETGGFVIVDPEAFDNLLAAALRYHTKTGKLAHRTEDGKLINRNSLKLNTRFRNEEFGLAEWVKLGKLDSLKENQ